MAKPRVTATDRLANVIDVVGLGRRTGLLSAEREFGTMLEEAEIYFVSGNPIYASLGPLQGHDALSALAQWSMCRFCFDPLAPQPIPNISGVLPAVDPSSPSGFSYAYTPSGPVNGSVGNGQFGSPSRYSGSDSQGNRSSGGYPSPVSRSSWNSPARPYPSGGLGGPDMNNAPNSPAMGNTSGNLGGNLGGNPGASGANWSASGITFGASGPSSSFSNNGLSSTTASDNATSATRPRSVPGAYPSSARPQSDPAMMPPGAGGAQANTMRRPRRAPDVRDLINVVTTYNLSRAHRTMLLLADGEHSILDLSRLSGKPLDEVLMLLGELEGRGLIYYFQ